MDFKQSFFGLGYYCLNTHTIVVSIRVSFIPWYTIEYTHLLVVMSRWRYRTLGN
jgi:hypothetical protein